MSFIALVLKNLLRQRVRTGLTVLGISIGITTVIALGVVVSGLKQTSGEIIRAGGADFMVAQRGSADLSFSSVTEDDWFALATLPEVERATGVLFYITRVEDNPFFVSLGIRPEDLERSHPKIVEGRLIAPGATDEIMLGSQAAATLKRSLGDKLLINSQEFRVVGIFSSGLLWEDGGGFVDLLTLQGIARRQAVVTVVYVKAKAGEDPEALATSIKSRFPRLAAMSDVGDYGEVDQGLQIMDAMNLAISALAVGIGAIGVMNTMVMSVFERTREIGILRAVGWSGRSILRMIILEALTLCLIAAAIGTFLGVLASRAVELIPTVGQFLEPSYPPELFLRGLAVAVLVALMGAAYPAYRAVRLTPMEALRHE